MPTNIWEDYLENKNMWDFHKPNFDDGVHFKSGISAFTGLRFHQSKTKAGELIGQEAVRGLNGKSLAFAENSQVNPMLKHDRFRPQRSIDLVDHWGEPEKTLIQETGKAIITFTKNFPPPIKTISSGLEFCRICPAWAVDQHGDASAKTFVAGDYNRWGNAPSLYCSPVVPHDRKTLAQAMRETIGKDSNFSPSSAANIQIPHHTIIEMVRNYRAHLGDSYIYWGQPLGKSLLLLDLSFSSADGNDYLHKMEQSPEVCDLLGQCLSRGLITSTSFGKLLVDKDERKSILDLFGWAVTNGVILGPAKMPFEGIFFTGANTKKDLGKVDSFQNHFVLFSKKNKSICTSIKMTKRVAVRHDKRSDLWAVTQTTPRA